MKQPETAARRGPLLRVLALGASVNIGTLWLFGKLAKGALERPTADVDRTLTEGMRKTRGRGLGPAVKALSGLGEPNALYPLVGIVAARWLAQGRGGEAATLALALGGSAGIDKVVKILVDRPRPRRIRPRQQSSGSSFPSQHLTMSMATYGTLVYLVNRRRKQARKRRLGPILWAPMILLVGLIGWSRVYEGVHHPTDVLAGVASGTLWLATCAAAARTLAPLS